MNTPTTVLTDWEQVAHEHRPHLATMHIGRLRKPPPFSTYIYCPYHSGEVIYALASLSLDAALVEMEQSAADIPGSAALIISACGEVIARHPVLSMEMSWLVRQAEARFRREVIHRARHRPPQPEQQLLV
jgi:hypothetical protein